MSVFQVMGIECDHVCTEEFEGAPYRSWRDMVADARKSGWRVSNDGMTAYCPAHRTLAQRSVPVVE